MYSRTVSKRILNISHGIFTFTGFVIKANMTLDRCIMYKYLINNATVECLSNFSFFTLSQNVKS